MRILKRTEWTHLGVLAIAAITIMLAGSIELFASEPPKKGRVFADEFTPTWQHAKAYSLEFAEAMPEEFYTFKPTPEIWSFAEQLVHCADSNFWFASKIKGEQSPGNEFKAEGKTKAEIIEYFKKSFDYIERILPDLSDEEAAKKIEGNFTKAQTFQVTRDHITHHRGQLVIYLRLKGIKPPQYVGW